MDFIYALWNNYGVPAIVISVLAWILTYAVKIPYKLLTGLIKDKDFRHLANIPIAFIPVGVGIGLWYLYCCIFTSIGAVDQMLIAGIFCGVGALLIYFAFGARLEAALNKVIKKQKRFPPLSAPPMRKKQICKKDCRHRQKVKRPRFRY